MLKAPINFIALMDEKPTYHMDPPPGVPEENVTYEEHIVAIHDARQMSPTSSLDREGFELVNHQTNVSNLYDIDAIHGTYYGELETLVKQVTGAKRVVAFDWNIRSSDAHGTEGGTPGREPDDDTPSDPEAVQTPVRSAHNDYTDRSGPQRVVDLMGEQEAKTLLRHRYAIINVWKPIRGPVKQVPLAFCDARSIGSGQLLDTDLVYPDRTGEVSMLTYAPKQCWYYVPEMQATEVVLLKCFDSDLAQPRFTAHSAFNDPTSDIDAPPRESIEVRTLAFF
jgi:hypothetical protein